MKNNVKVSVVVPIYNVERYLRETLESLRVQTLRDIEIICVNDGSTDGSLSIIEEYLARDNRFSCINKENAGYGHTINRGIEAANAPYIGILESDDFCADTMFETLYRCAIEHDADIVRSGIELYWSEPEKRTEPMLYVSDEECGKLFDPREYEQCFYFPPALCSMLVRRAIITENNLELSETPGASYQDTAFSFMLWACAQRGIVLSDAFIFYRQDNEASSINQRGKLPCVPYEYQRLEEFLQSDKARFSDLLPTMIKRKFAAYIWNYERIAPEYHLEFAQIMGEAFTDAEKKELLDSEKFSADQWSDVQMLMRDPSAFVTLKDESGKIATRSHYLADRIKRKLHAKHE